MTLIHRPGQASPPYTYPTKANPIANVSLPHFSGTFESVNGPHRFSFRETLGPKRTRVSLQQGADITKKNTIQDCYFLSILDILLHHPRAEELLDLFTQEPLPGTISENRYRVRFPSGRMTDVTVPKAQDEDGVLRTNFISLPGFSKPLQGVTSDSRDIRLLERAFVKIRYEDVQAKQQSSTDKHNHNPADLKTWLNIRTPAEALNLLFTPPGAETLPDITFNPEFMVVNGQFNLYAPSESTSRTKRHVPRVNPQHETNLSTHLHTVRQSSAPQILLALLQPGGPSRARDLQGKTRHFIKDHYYAIRQETSGAHNVITLADPFDTKNDVFQLSITDFAKIFHVEGCELKNVLPHQSPSLPYFISPQLWQSHNIPNEKKRKPLSPTDDESLPLNGKRFKYPISPTPFVEG